MTDRRIRALLAEDDADVREALSEILRLNDVEVFPACDGEQALAALTAAPAPDVVILDLALPGLDGRTFLAAKASLSEAAARIPVVIVSGTAQGAFGLPGVAATFEKPFDPEALVARVRRIVGPTEALS